MGDLDSRYVRYDVDIADSRNQDEVTSCLVESGFKVLFCSRSWLKLRSCSGEMFQKGLNH